MPSAIEQDIEMIGEFLIKATKENSAATAYFIGDNKFRIKRDGTIQFKGGDLSPAMTRKQFYVLFSGYMQVKKDPNLNTKKNFVNTQKDLKPYLSAALTASNLTDTEIKKTYSKTGTGLSSKKKQEEVKVGQPKNLEQKTKVFKEIYDELRKANNSFDATGKRVEFHTEYSYDPVEEKFVEREYNGVSGEYDDEKNLDPNITPDELIEKLTKDLYNNFRQHIKTFEDVEEFHDFLKNKVKNVANLEEEWNNYHQQKHPFKTYEEEQEELEEKRQEEEEISDTELEPQFLAKEEAEKAENIPKRKYSNALKEKVLEYIHEHYPKTKDKDVEVLFEELEDSDASPDEYLDAFSNLLGDDLRAVFESEDQEQVQVPVRKAPLLLEDEPSPPPPESQDKLLKGAEHPIKITRQNVRVEKSFSRVIHKFAIKIFFDSPNYYNKQIIDRLATFGELSKEQINSIGTGIIRAYRGKIYIDQMVENSLTELNELIQIQFKLEGGVIGGQTLSSLENFASYLKTPEVPKFGAQDIEEAKAEIFGGAVVTESALENRASEIDYNGLDIYGKPIVNKRIMSATDPIKIKKKRANLGNTIPMPNSAGQIDNFLPYGRKESDLKNDPIYHASKIEGWNNNNFDEPIIKINRNKKTRNLLK